MKKVLLFAVMVFLTVVGVNAQTKKDGTPDMRYKANKEMYGNGYAAPKYSTPGYSTPIYTKQKQERHYSNGGAMRMQEGYMRSNGTYVQPHIKTTPDSKKWNNIGSWPK